MNRVDRLTAILLHLQERKLSGDALARRFEVSRRTIMRDIQALCEMGIPIVAEAGPSGGYSLINFTLRPLALNLHEAFLLQSAMDALEASPYLARRAIRQSVRAKIRSLMPEHMKTHVDTLMVNVEHRSKGGDTSLPLFDPILTALQDERWIRVDYTSMERRSTQLLYPQKLYVQDGFWYLNAYSHERGEERTYRVGRISNVHAAEPPPEGRRNTARDTWGDPALPEVVVALTHRGVMEVERTLSWTTVYRTESGGELRLRCPADEYRWLSRVVLGLSHEAKVLSPPVLVDMVRRGAHDVLKLYEAPKNK